MFEDYTKIRKSKKGTQAQTRASNLLRQEVVSSDERKDEAEREQNAFAKETNERIQRQMEEQSERSAEQLSTLESIFNRQLESSELARKGLEERNSILEGRMGASKVLPSETASTPTKISPLTKFKGRRRARTRSSNILGSKGVSTQTLGNQIVL